MINSEEIPLLIPCDDTFMVGVLHQPVLPTKTGVLIIPAGGPQYRVGSARQIILWSRRLANEGYPVLRFDYRGFGDSGGHFKGFEYINEDIAAALEAFMQKMEHLENVILWGECNAASSILMYAWRDSRIKGMILQNPWVRNETTQARTFVKHYYLMRIMQKSFWLKLSKLQFNLISSLTEFLKLLRQFNNFGQNRQEHNYSQLIDFQDKMREGLALYQGKLLLLMSGYSLIGKEFDELVGISPRWQMILQSKSLTRIDHPEADHTFSRIEDREKLIVNILTWLEKL